MAFLWVNVKYETLYYSTAPTTPPDVDSRPKVHIWDECIPSVSLRCSQDSRSLSPSENRNIRDSHRAPVSLPAWLMKADKSDEKIPTQTIPSEAYLLSDISASIGENTKITCKICVYWPQMKLMMPMSFVWVCDIHCPDVIVIPTLRGRRVTLIRNDADTLSLSSVDTVDSQAATV